MNILSKKYWKEAVIELKSLQKICLAGIFISLFVALDVFGKMVNINPFSRRVAISFFALVVSGWVLGPVANLFIAFCCDVLSWLLFSNGYPFHPGYTFSRCLEGFTYGIFFYRQEICILKILFARMFVNFFIHAFLGSVWMMTLTAKNSFAFFLKMGFAKNSLTLLFDVFLILCLLKVLKSPFIELSLVKTEINTFIYGK